jgi:Syntaxin 6, N-terminal
MDNDPFNAVKESPTLQSSPDSRDILRKLTLARSLLSSYTRIRSTTVDPLTSPELANTKSDLDALLTDLSDLDDLDAAVAVAEQDPSRYALSVEEVRRRRGFVETIKDQVDDLKRATARAQGEEEVCPLGSRVEVDSESQTGLSCWIWR